MKKENKGITLVALVVTVIILLILAGISIASLTGNGLFEKAKLAKEKYEQAKKDENEILSDYDRLISGSNRNDKKYDEKIYDEWTTWLYLAGIENPEKYNKGKIIENENLMNTLLNNDNSVNYMIQSTDFIMPAICNSEISINYIIQNEKVRSKVLTNSSWIEGIKKGGFMNKFDDVATKVPTLTTETNIIYSTVYPNCSPISPFNGYIPVSGWLDSYIWIPKGSTEDNYIGYKFNEPVMLYKFSLTSARYENNTNQYSFILQGLDENGLWENIGNEYITDFTSSQIFITKDYYINSTKKYYGYRIKNNYSISGNGTKNWHVYPISAFGIGELQFYCIK